MARKHYHVLIGDHGYMPESNYVCTSKRQALQLLSDEGKNNNSDYGCWDEESSNYHTGKCYTGKIKDESIEFLPGHGAEYAEISECYEIDCLESED